MLSKKDLVWWGQRHHALEIVRRQNRPGPHSAVSLLDLTQKEAALMKRRHERGPPLFDFQRDMFALVSEKDPSQQDVLRVSSDLHPGLFLRQMSSLYQSASHSFGRSRLEEVVRPHRLLPEFKARLESGIVKGSDDDLVVRQQRVNLPAYQADLSTIHKSAYSDWLCANGFPNMAQSAIEQRRHDSAVRSLLARPILGRILGL